MTSPRRSPGRLRMVALVLSTVLIQVLVAILLKELADAGGGNSWAWLLLALAVAVGLNALRFAVWGYTHRHYPLSHSYPLTALFFPCILLLSAWYGETIAWTKVVGVGVIVAGLALVTWEARADV